MHYKVIDEISLNFLQLFIIGDMQKSGLKTGDAILKRLKTLQKLNKRDCVCLHSRFHFLLRFWRKN